MTRIPGPIDYSDGYPPRRSRRRAAPKDDQATTHPAREFAREARQQNDVQHRARRVVAPEEDEELAERRQRARDLRQKKRQPLWKWARRIAGVLLLAGLFELVVAALTSPTFQIKSVQIEGAQITPRERINAITAPLAGQNWLRAKTKSATQRLVTLPTVKSAHIKREVHWPPRLKVEIEERRPFVRIGSGDAWWVADETGVPFRLADKSDDGLYAITSPKLAPQLGVALKSASWKRAAEITRALESEKQGGQNWALRRIYLDENDFASLRLSGGAHDEMLVRLGATEWPQKLERARQALEYFDQTGRRAQTLNLVSYNRPAWTPLVASSSQPETDGEIESQTEPSENDREPTNQ